MYPIDNAKNRQGHGTMVPAEFIFREISCFSALNLETLLRCCVLGQATSLSNASLDSGKNE